MYKFTLVCVVHVAQCEMKMWCMYNKERVREGAEKWERERLDREKAEREQAEKE